MLRWSAWYLLLVVVLATFYGCGGGSGSSDSTTGAITGTLVTSAGSPKALAGVTSSTPLAGVTVKVIGYDSLHAVTDSSGNFTINNVPPGSYDLLAETFVGQGATHVSIRKRGVAVAAGSNNRVGIMSLIPSGRIQGVFRLEGAADHRGIVVYTLELGRFYNAWHTWTSGGFEISGIPEGTYTLKVHKIGYEDITVHDVVVASNQQVTLDPQTLIKLPGATVRGTVEVSPLASPAALVAKLTVPKTGEYFQAEVKDGAYRFDGVVPGQYTLSVGDDLIPIGNPGTRNGQV